MDEKTASALARRLAAYAATAGITLAVAPSADAQVVYHDLDPDRTVSLGGAFPLDLDDDGRIDFVFEHFRYNQPEQVGPGRGMYDLISLDTAQGAPGQDAVLVYETYYAARLSSGYAITPTPPGPLQFNNYTTAVIARYDSSYGPDGAFVGEEGFAGFRFVGADGGLHYGWIRLAANELATMGTAFEYAYEATPDTPITAGAVSAALLDGAVNQTTFPPEGGTLVYTFTVANTTGAPLPLDLWLHAVGPVTFVRRLGSGTLPAGATVTRTVRVQVPAGAPTAGYNVRFKLGDFASGQFITFERYTVIKEAGAEAVGAAEAFAVEPVAGDLFAEAGAAAGLAGTHALTAPMPNPTTERAEVTLAVAEAQAVTVAVYDALGRRVALLHDGPMAAGVEHRLSFDGSALPAGVYVVRAVGEAFADARVLSLTR